MESLYILTGAMRRLEKRAKEKYKVAIVKAD
jgi:hypothetical protein